MANISSYLEEALLSHVFRNVEYTRPGATIYIAIFDDTAVEADLEAGTVAGGAFTDEITTYAEANRPGVAFNEATPFQQAGKATVVSAADVEYTVMPAVTVKYVAACDNATKGAGNILYWAELGTPRTAVLGDEVKFEAGDIQFDLD